MTEKQLGSDEWKSFIKKFNQTHLIKNDENKNEYLEKTNISQMIGKKRLSFRNDFRLIKKHISLFIKDVMDEEKTKEVKNSPLHRVYRSKFIKHLTYSCILLYGLPILFMLKTKKMNQLGVFRLVLLSPLLIFFKTFVNAVNMYTINKNALVLLFAVDQFYKEDSQVYNKYLKFMDTHNLKFIQENSNL